MRGGLWLAVNHCDGIDVASSVRATVQELEINSLAAGGDGVGRVDGLAVFVPRSAPGDVISASVRVQGRFARGTVLSVLHAAPERVEAPCVHFVRDDCGGCQWQHLHIDAQRAAKAQLVVDAFARIAKQHIAVPPVHGDERTLAYRRTISLTVRGSGAQRVGGFHSQRDPDVIVPIERCLIAESELQAAWDVIRRNVARLPVTRVDAGGPGGKRVGNGSGAPRATSGARDKSHIVSRRIRRAASQPVVRGTVRDDLRVSLRALDSGDVALVVQGGVRWHGDDIALLAERVPACSAVWWQPGGRDVRLVWDRDANADVIDSASSSSRDDALQLAASFVQVNRTVAAALHAHVLQQVMSAAPRTAVDAYAGTGRLSVALAKAGVSVTSIEHDAQAVAFTALQLPAGSRAMAGRVEQLLSDALPADVVVLNPPRSGVDEAVTHALSRSAESADATTAANDASPELLIYVSCDPATLARDVARLSGWRVDSVTCFDMFPQTSHVETVCVLRPEAK